MDLLIILKSFIKAFIALAKSLLFLSIPLILLGLLFVFIFIAFYFYFRFVKGIKPIQANKVVTHTSLFKKIFIQFPKQLALDILERNNNEFMNYGIHIVVGQQGSGKTTCMVYLLEEWKKRYPLVKIYTNMEYLYQDGSIEHWRQLIDRKNGIYGTINCIDEIQTWFPASRTASSVPPEMIGEISQQRKQRKCIFGTVQVFKRLSVNFREQVRFVYVPKTYLGCFTIVRVTEPKYYDPEKDTFTKYKRTFFFAHTREIREAFDTYKIIEKYKDIEFVKDSTILSTGSELPNTSEAEEPTHA